MKVCFQQEGVVFGAIVLENGFDKTTGVEVCRVVRIFDCDTPIVFLSGEARPHEIAKALAAGADAYLVKPQDFEKLEQTVIGPMDSRRVSASIRN